MAESVSMAWDSAHGEVVMLWGICPVCGWKGWRDESDPATCEGEG